MEEREGVTSGGGGGGGSSDAPEMNGELGMMPAPLPATEGMVVKKKRGRPRKLKPGEAPPPTTVVMSPKPISSAGPLPSVIDFSAAKRAKLESRAFVGNSNFGASCIFLLLMIKFETSIEFDYLAMLSFTGTGSELSQFVSKVLLI